MTTCGTSTPAACGSAAASTCGGGLHRSRTPKYIENEGGQPPVAADDTVDPPTAAIDAVPSVVVLDTAIGKNWSVELTGSYVNLQLKMGTKSGRRGTICVKNDKSVAGDGTYLNDANAITNVHVTVPAGANVPLFVGSESSFLSGENGLSIGPQETVVLRYYLNGPSGSALFPVVELLTSR